MTRLWQRNLIGAAVSAVALAVIIATTLWPDWSDYRKSTDPEHVVAADESGEAAGMTWRIDSVRYLNTSGTRLQPDLPRGTLLHVVTLESSGAGVTGCSGVITDGHRRWPAEPGGGYGPFPPDGTSSFCGRPGPVQFNFLLPDDVSPTAVDLTDWTGRILVRLML
jgi:hypothetical protein